MLGQIYLSMAKPLDAIPAYQKAVNLQAPGAAIAAGAGGGRSWPPTMPALSPAALANLKAASLAENDDVFTWYETAQAYSNLKNVPMANLSTAESYYAAGAMQQAAMFATARPARPDPGHGGLGTGQ